MAYTRKTMPVREYQNRVRIITGVFILIGLLALVLIGGIVRSRQFHSPVPVLRTHLVERVHAVEVPVYIAPESIEDKIRATFGEHADKAFRVLECENRGLDPKAINYNTDARKTRDLGIFQINDYWQGIRHQGKADQFLLDPDINIQIAWILYRDSGYSFKMWTCGRNLGL
jgi:hypothetical protein